MAVRNVPPTQSYEAGTATRGRSQQRSFAELYEQARRSSGNDNADDEAAQRDARAREAEENRKYIEGLHERVDTLRGELLVRVIQSSGTLQSAGGTRDTAGRLDGDISRLSNRLNQLRAKLQNEEGRLSGKLFDVEV